MIFNMDSDSSLFLDLSVILDTALLSIIMDQIVFNLKSEVDYTKLNKVPS